MRRNSRVGRKKPKANEQTFITIRIIKSSVLSIDSHRENIKSAVFTRSKIKQTIVTSGCGSACSVKRKCNDMKKIQILDVEFTSLVIQRVSS